MSSRPLAATSLREAFGERVRDRRVQLRLNQQVVADAVGLIRTALSAIETGQRNTTISELISLAEVLNTPVGDLLGDSKGVTMQDVQQEGHQVGGTHYEQMPMMPFAIIDAFGLDFYAGNALKYLLRAGRKPGVDPIEDLKKARHYLDEMIERAEQAS